MAISYRRLEKMDECAPNRFVLIFLKTEKNGLLNTEKKLFYFLFFFILPIDKQQLNQVSGTLKLLR
jgi:hypothetical protein